MIARYTRPEIGAIWTDEARFGAMRDVEVAAAEALDGPTPEDLDAIRAATFTVDAINEREKITDHDTAAFVDVLAASAGPAGRWIHYGLTSSDVVDTGLALQLKRAGELLVPAARAARVGAAPRRRASTPDTLCVGRTHGVHAEPTSFGLKLAGYAMEAHRNAERLERAFAQTATAAISGAVGTYATLGPDYEERVLAKLGLAAEPISTQVVPRDRHAELLSRDRAGRRRAGALRDRDPPPAAHRGARGRGAVPRRARRARARCRTSATRSSAERICGLARVLRGNAQVGLENVALWHERDISHSSAERIVLPDSTILLDQVLALALRVVRGMTVHADRMRANLELTSGALFSQRVLLALVAGGMQRDDAYRIVQRLGQQAWDTQTPLRTLLEQEDVEHRPRRGLRLRLLRAPRARGAGAAGGDPIAVLIYGAPEISADLFHEVPAGIGDPFLYLENDGRRVADGQRARRRQGLRARHRGDRPGDARQRRADRAGPGPRWRIEAELCAARLPRGWASPRPTCRRSSRSSSPTTCAPTGSS